MSDSSETSCLPFASHLSTCTLETAMLPPSPSFVILTAKRTQALWLQQRSLDIRHKQCNAVHESQSVSAGDVSDKGSMTLSTNQQWPQASARPRVQDSGAVSSEVKNPQPTLQQEPLTRAGCHALGVLLIIATSSAMRSMPLSCARRTTSTTSKCPAYTTNPKLGSTAPCASEASSDAAS